MYFFLPGAYYVCIIVFLVFNPGVPGVGAAVQSVQSAAEQGLSAAMMKMQVCVDTIVLIGSIV